MALLWCDSFDHYPSGSTKKWTAARNGNAVFLTGGRFGNGWESSTRWSSYSLGASYATLIFGSAFYFNGPPIIEQWSFRDAGTTQVSIVPNPTAQTIQAHRDSARAGGALIGSASYVWQSSLWYFVETKVTFHDTTGSVVVRINGQTALTLTNVDTKVTANATANTIMLGEPSGNSFGGVIFDDVYVADTSGAAPSNDFFGDVRVDALLPSGNGNSSQFIGSDANQTDNYLLVDEATANDDTDYVESATVTEKDTYAYADLSTTAGTIHGLQMLPYVRKTSAGTRSTKSIARLAGVEEDGPEKFLSTGYAYASDMRLTKPGGGVWTIADVNAAEFGIKVAA